MNIKRTFFILIIIVSGFSCAKQVRHPVPKKHINIPGKAYWNPVMKKWIVRDKANTITLYYTTSEIYGKGQMYIDENGTLTDLRHGLWKFWYKNGTIRQVENYAKGEWNGEFKIYHKNGKVNLVGSCKNSLYIGTWKYYNETGKLIRLEKYKHNKIYYFKDYIKNVTPPQKLDFIPKETTFSFSLKVWQMRDSSDNYYSWYLNGNFAWLGKVTKDKKLFDDITFWRKNGKVLMRGSYKNNKEDGVWKYYTRTGTFREKRVYKNGKMISRELSNGMQVPVNLPRNVVWIKKIKKWRHKDSKNNIATLYYKDGTKYQEGSYVNNNIAHGKWITYYRNGKIKHVGTFKNNKRHGIWRTFYRDGKPSAIMHFKNGKLVKKTKIQ